MVPYVGGTAACPGDVAGNGKVTGNGKVADGPQPPQVAVPGWQNSLSAQRGDIFPPVINPQFPKKGFGKFEKVIFMMVFLKIFWKILTFIEVRAPAVRKVAFPARLGILLSARLGILRKCSAGWGLCDKCTACILLLPVPLPPFPP